jgi:hypothetical protein
MVRNLQIMSYRENDPKRNAEKEDGKGKETRSVMSQLGAKLPETPTVEETHDLALCHSMLGDLRTAGDRSRSRAKQAQHLACRMTLEMVTLFCDAAAEAVEKYLDLSKRRVALKLRHFETEAAKRPLSDSVVEWRPGEPLQGDDG